VALKETAINKNFCPFDFNEELGSGHYPCGAEKRNLHFVENRAGKPPARYTLRTLMPASLSRLSAVSDRG
jgi:hypothetical protein